MWDSSFDSDSGSPREFSTTHWSVVVQAGDSDSPEADNALEQLCRAYWYPLYAYVRRQGHPPHDAQDLTQSFFERLLERKFLKLADPQRGRFRTFLLTSLKHFLINEWEKANCEKHGDRRRTISLDEEIAEARFTSEPVTEQPPDALYDRGWADAIIDSAKAALRAEFEQSGKLDSFERFKPSVWGEKHALSYAAIAERSGVTEGAVKVAVHRLRQRFGDLVRSEIAKTVSTPAEVNTELSYLVAVLREGSANSGNVARENL